MLNAGDRLLAGRWRDCVGGGRAVSRERLSTRSQQCLGSHPAPVRRFAGPIPMQPAVRNGQLVGTGPFSFQGALTAYDLSQQVLAAFGELSLPVHRCISSAAGGPLRGLRQRHRRYGGSEAGVALAARRFHGVARFGQHDVSLAVGDCRGTRLHRRIDVHLRPPAATSPIEPITIPISSRKPRPPSMSAHCSRPAD